jgi:enoyl-CoA hydratase/carnithine racemase
MQMDHVIYEVDDQVGVITLDRPEAANAQSPKVLAELDSAWREADLDPQVKVIVFKSNGKHFSAGHDMSSTDADPSELAMDFSSTTSTTPRPGVTCPSRRSPRCRASASPPA